jgi:hypothetical protein
LSESTYLVGAVRTEITPRVGVRLGGYGARHGVADRVGDPLWATAFVFSDRSATVCVVTCDLLYVTTDIRDAVRSRVVVRTGLPGEAIVLVATHTHSGPSDLTLETDADYVGLLGERIADAIERALRVAEPATVRVSTAGLSGIGQNRRDPLGPVEDTMRTIVAECIDGGRTIAVLMNYACHPTVLEFDSLAISPDFPGRACDLVASVTGATVGYLQGCAGAINPVWLEHTADEVNRIGTLVGSVALRQVLDGRGVGRPRRSVNLSVAADVDAPPGPMSGTMLSGPIWHDTAVAALTRRPVRPTEDIEREIAEVRGGVNAAHRIAVARLVSLQAECFLSRDGFRYWPSHGAVGGLPHTEPVEISAVGFGESLALIGIPAEPFLEIGRALRDRSRAAELLVCGYTNGMIGYLPTRAAFPDFGYEVGMARYSPDSADRVIAAGAGLLGKDRM